VGSALGGLLGAALGSTCGSTVAKSWPVAAVVFGVTGISGMAGAAGRLDETRTGIVGASDTAMSFVLAQRVCPEGIDLHQVDPVTYHLPTGWSKVFRMGGLAILGLEACAKSGSIPT
jgi:hypothetical protein